MLICTHKHSQQPLKLFLQVAETHLQKLMLKCNATPNKMKIDNFG